MFYAEQRIIKIH